MAYQALYREWRPKTFADVVGQEVIITTLRNQITAGRIAHAYLFSGSRGTGKTSTAKILARAVNCEQPAEGDACGVCASCRSQENGESLDIIEIDAASNNGVEEMRDLRENVKYPPQFGRYKVYIIDEVHMLSTSAFNALLKTLEEPPSYIIFILATTEPQKLPATILSRCQRFDFGRIPAHQLVGRMQQVVDAGSIEAEPKALEMIARAAEGGMRDALSLLDTCIGFQDHIDEALVRRILGTSSRSFLFRFAEGLELKDTSALFSMIDELVRAGREPLVFSKDIAGHLRSLLIAKTCPDDTSSLLDITQEDALEYINQASHFDITRLMKMMEIFMQVETELRWSSSPRITLETHTLKACLRTDESDRQALTDRISELEQQLKELNDKLSSGVYSVTKAPVETAITAKENKPASSKPKEAAAPKGSASDQTVWNDMIAEMRKSNPMIPAMLNQGKVSVPESRHYVLTYNDSIYDTIISVHRSTIIESLSRIAGEPCTFDAHCASSAPVSAPGLPEDEPQDLIEAFGRENVMIQK